MLLFYGRVLLPIVATGLVIALSVQAETSPPVITVETLRAGCSLVRSTTTRYFRPRHNVVSPLRILNSLLRCEP